MINTIDKPGGSWVTMLLHRAAGVFSRRRRPQQHEAPRAGDDPLTEMVKSALEPELAERVVRLHSLLAFGIGTFMVRRRYFPSQAQIREIAEIVAAADAEHRQAGLPRVVH